MGNDRRREGSGGEERDVNSIINTRLYVNCSLLEYLGTQNVITKKNIKVNKPQMRILGQIPGDTFSQIQIDIYCYQCFYQLHSIVTSCFRGKV